MALTKATLIDLNSNELILDLDADTSITADTDDTIHFKIAGSDELVMTGTALTPAAADGSALGSTSLEWSDLFLADGATIKFGADQDITLTHVADTGLNLKHTATGDDKPIILTLYLLPHPDSPSFFLILPGTILSRQKASSVT